MTTELPDHDLLERWAEFRNHYVKLGYRVASFEYFAAWLNKSLPGGEFSAEQIRRRIHASRKRHRSRQSPADRTG